jgi:hypothetical protein
MKMHPKKIKSRRDDIIIEMKMHPKNKNPEWMTLLKKFIIVV